MLLSNNELKQISHSHLSQTAHDAGSDVINAVNDPDMAYKRKKTSNNQSEKNFVSIQFCS